MDNCERLTLIEELRKREQMCSWIAEAAFDGTFSDYGDPRLLVAAARRAVAESEVRE